MRAVRWFVLASVALPAACGGGEPPGGDSASAASGSRPPAWSLGSRPLVDIGVVAGAESYQLSNVTAATLLPGGRVAVADQGSAQVRVFDGEGRFLVSSGRVGEGPGEWRRLTRLRSLGADTLAVFDIRLDRVGFVDASDGSFLGTADSARAAALWPPLAFRAGLLIEGVGPGDLAVLASVLRTLDVFAPEAPARLLVEPDGTVLAFPAPGDGPRSIRAFDLAGRERGRLALPRRFTPLQVTRDRVVGVRRDSLDVEHVQVWALSGRGSAAGSGLASARRATADPLLPYPTVGARELPWWRDAVVGVAREQEMHYAGHMTYTDDLARLGTPRRPLALPEGVEVQILEGDGSGWMARFLHPGTRTGCFIAYGLYRLPEGVHAGETVCWESTAEG